MIYDLVAEKLRKNTSYSSEELIEIISKINPDLSVNTYRWDINHMVRDRILVHQGYNKYSLSDDSKLIEYQPVYSDMSKELIELISKEYPYVRFTVFETALMNEFLNHMIAQNTVFIQTEKESSIFLFRFLQDKNFKKIMFRPDRKDYDLYWEKDCIIINDMITEAPLNKNNPHSITLEKMLVDMYADKIISLSYSKSEYPDIIEQAEGKYLFDKTKLLRYARRRNKHNDLIKYFEGSECNAG